MEKQLIRPCPVCAHARGDVLYPARFVLTAGHPLVDRYDVVMCGQCGFAFADTASSQVDYDRYYQRHSKYEDAATSTGSSVSPSDQKRIAVTAAHIAGLMPERGLAMVDIGCANGGLLAGLHALGYTDLTGIDPSPVCARNTAARAGMTAKAGTFFQLPEFGRKFDLAIFTGVLEHVRDIAGAIDAVGSLLAPKGHVYITVPDAARYADLPDAPFQEFNIEHVNHFTVASLTNFMQAQGYRAVAVEQQAFDPAFGHDSLAVVGLFQRLPEVAAVQPWVEDAQARGQLQHYIDVSQATMDQLEQQLAAFFAAHPALILWGTGQLALKLLALPCVQASQILALVDGNPINQGETLLGRPILAPEAVRGMTAPIVILTTLHQAPIAQRIREQLKMDNAILTFAVT